MPPAVLFVADFPPGTGYAWDFIGAVYADLGKRAEARGWRSVTAYERIPSLRYLRRNRVRTLYLTDRAAWSHVYSLVRLAGVRRVVVHDHSSGDRTPPRGLKRLLKRARGWLPGSHADVVIAVSDFVAQRKREVDLAPPERVHTVRNPIRPEAIEPTSIRAAFGIPDDRPALGCACRAAPYKGVDVLIRAMDAVDAALVYFGDGPEFGRLKELRDGLAHPDRVIMAGYRPDARSFMATVDVAVVPSVWQEAFGLSALEPQAAGVPVIASRVGGLPEVVADGESGVLVPPGDPNALVAAIHRLLADSTERVRMGRAGMDRARTLFAWEAAMDRIEALTVPEVGAGTGEAFPLQEGY